MKITKKLIKIFFILAAICFIIFPFSKANLYLRIYFTNPDVTSDDSISEGSYALYYASNIPNAFSPEQLIQSEVDVESQCVTFKLDKNLADNLSGLRIDFPTSDNLLCISNITVSSAGIVQKQFNPCVFFADENILLTNDIGAISLASATNRAYIQTGNVDPYVILSEQMVSEIAQSFSSYRLTRLGICLFIFATYFIAKKNIFSKNV